MLRRYWLSVLVRKPEADAFCLECIEPRSEAGRLLKWASQKAFDADDATGLSEPVACQQRLQGRSGLEEGNVTDFHVWPNILHLDCEGDLFEFLVIRSNRRQNHLSSLSYAAPTCALHFHVSIHDINE